MAEEQAAIERAYVTEPATPEFPAQQTDVTLAQLPLRLIAWLIDAAILLVGIYSVFVTAAAHLLDNSLVGVVATLVFLWLYHAVLESSRWQATIGKRLLRLRVVDDNGQRIGFLRACARSLLRMFTLFFFNLGFLLALFTKGHKTLYDLGAGTLVVRS